MKCCLDCARYEMPEIIAYNQYFGGCKKRFARIPTERLKTFRCNNYMEKTNEKIKAQDNAGQHGRKESSQHPQEGRP